MNNADTNTMIYLVSNTNTRHEVDKKSIQLSVLISDMTEDNDDNVIPLNFSDELIVKTIEYCNYYPTDPHPTKSITKGEMLKSSDISKYVSEWYVNYLNIDTNFLMNLIKIADFLHIDPLLELCCFKFASLMKGKTADEIKKDFKIEDMTGEEKEEFVQSHNWTM